MIAGNNWQFRDWVSARPESERPHCVELKTVKHLVGWENVEVHFVGTWRNRQDSRTVELEAKRRNDEGKIVKLIYWVE